jgi:hypothetical protein
MSVIIQEILNWSEAWAPLVALLCAFAWRPRGKWVTPLIIFLVLAFLANLTSDLIWKRRVLGIDDWMYRNFTYFYNFPPPPGEQDDLSNQILYNIHSILRFIFFAWFFHYLGRVFRIMNLVLVPAFIFGMGVVFSQYKDIRELSSLLMATDSALLLVYCLVYYFFFLRDENASISSRPHFWAVLGLSIYVVINFPIFLFYTVISEKAETFAINIWDIHNISYIIFCIFLAKAFHAARKSRKNLNH